MSYETIPSPNNSKRDKDVNGVVIHFTGGGDIEGTVQWFKNTKSKASAHYVISRSGRIVNMVSEDRSAWHAGSPTTVPKLNDIADLNDWTIGIEICNWGYLYKETEDTEIEFKGHSYTRKAGKIYTRMKKWSHEFHGEIWDKYIVKSNVPSNNKRNPWPGTKEIKCWEVYTSEQIESLTELIKEIIERHSHITRKWITEHQSVDPTRKLDPGPALQLDNILDEVFRLPEVYKLDRRLSEDVTEQDMLDMYEGRNCSPTFCRKLFS